MITQELLIKHLQSEPPKTIDQWIDFFSYDDKNTQQLKQLIQQLMDDYVIGLSKKDKLYVRRTKEVIKGTLFIQARGDAKIKTIDEEFVVSLSGLNGALHQDEVIALRDHNQELKIVKIIQRKLNSFVVKVAKDELIPLQDRIPYPIRSSRALDPHWIEGTLLHVKPTRFDTILFVEVIERIGYAYDPGVDITARLIDFQIPIQFSEKTLKEVNQIPMQVSDAEKQGRQDYSNELVFTIDGEDAKDFDDAISIESYEGGYRLCVHIADVSHYVKAFSSLDEEAQNRGTSIYLLDRVVPMLPQALSNGICSLVEGEARLTLTCRMDIDVKGHLKDYDLHPSWIVSKKRMTYTQVNAFLENQAQAREELKPFSESLQLMEQCSQAIRQQRVLMGMLDFESSESKFILNDQNKIQHIEARVQGEAEKMIEDCMIMANQVVASHMDALEYPNLYRVHAKPDKAKLTDFINLARFFNVKLHPKKLGPLVLQKLLDDYRDQDVFVILNDALLRSMKKAVYDDRCEGHYGLGLDHYCHFTSPIRRYPDLIVHRMLRKYGFEHHYQDMDKDRELVEALGHQCSVTERRAMDVERDVEAMKKAEYMSSFIGNVYTGIISGLVPYGFYVRLENTVEGLVHVRHLEGYYEYDPEHYVLFKRGGKKRYMLGQKVKIRVLSADKNRKSIDFEVV